MLYSFFAAMDTTKEELVEVMETMASSLAAARAAMHSIKQKELNLDTVNGISLLSLKHHMVLSYLQSLVMVSAHRVLGKSLKERAPPTQPFGSKDRDSRGNNPGDFIDSMIEKRAVLEKVEVLESKMRYQIEKLVRMADEPTKNASLTDDPLAFKPNPMSLMQSDSTTTKEQSGYQDQFEDEDKAEEDAIYRPPRLAPMPYVEKSNKNKERQKRAPIPSALATLAADPSQPFVETTSGLGGAPSMASGRAQYLKRLKDFEEENFTRLIMKKSDARRRARDEEDLALGGDLGGGVGHRSRRGAGQLEDEFSEVLRSVSRVTGGKGQGDGYEELRKRGKKTDVLERSRNGTRKRDADDFAEGQDAPRMKKRSRFELATKVAKKKLSKR